MKKDLQYYMRLPYKMMIESIPEEEGGGYSASIPQLGKYAFTGDGETIPEAVENLEKIKQDLFSDYLEEGLAIPEPQREEEEYSGNFVVRIPKYLHRELALSARSNGVSLNQFVVSILSSGFQQEKFSSKLDRMVTDMGFVRERLSEFTYKMAPCGFIFENITGFGFKNLDERAQAA